MEKNGYVYLRDNEWYIIKKLIKCGISFFTKDRENGYITGEPIKGEYINIIEIPLKYNLHDVDKEIKLHFKKLHIYLGGGTEFYSRDIINLLPEYLQSNYEGRNLSKIEINEIERKERILFGLEIEENKSTEEIKRDQLQKNYIEELVHELNINKKAFLKAPTGFGKTHIYYKIILEMKCKKILFLTPRILLNEQIVEDKYSFYIKTDISQILQILQFNSVYSNKVQITENCLVTCCYQSGNKLLNYIKQNNFVFDLIIFDEAHFITSWTDSDKQINELLSDSNITKYRLFGSATPTEKIESQPLLYGKIIEKVKIYDLINEELLCNIETIIKQLNEKKSEYHNLKDLIINSMVKYNKKKGIIYVNTCKNARSLYDLLNTQQKIKSYLFISGNEFEKNKNQCVIKKFEKNKNQCVIICVGMISYGYDNPFIDFICLGDPRQSDIDIRQIIGRGLRWNKQLYPNKLLHLLVPLYRDEFGNCSKNEHLKKYLDYIIGECGQDIIYKSDGTASVRCDKFMKKNMQLDYDGENIPIEILNEYCTTGYNKFTDFKKFLKANQIYDELSYNLLRKKQKWIIPIGEIIIKYPKFCFRDIHPNNIIYYWNKNKAIEATIIAKNLLIKKMGRDNYSELTHDQLIKKYNLIDNKIPNIDIDLYYPNDC